MFDLNGGFDGSTWDRNPEIYRQKVKKPSAAFSTKSHQYTFSQHPYFTSSMPPETFLDNLHYRICADSHAICGAHTQL